MKTGSLKRGTIMAAAAGILISCGSSNSHKTMEKVEIKTNQECMEDKTLTVKELSFSTSKPTADEIEYTFDNSPGSIHEYEYRLFSQHSRIPVVPSKIIKEIIFLFFI